MKHLHLDSCDSTQDYLKEQLTHDASQELLVTCENQTMGHGRNQKKWEPLPDSLYMSFTLSPNEKVTWTAIELSVILADYFFEKFGENIKLKWPNDLYDFQSKKCGGILIQQSHQKNIAGIGLNLISRQEWGGIFKTLPINLTKSDWCLDLYNYISTHRITNTDELKSKFMKSCVHSQIPVTITEGNDIYSGVFTGLGDWGEALIESDQKTHHIYNGTLRW